MDLYSLFLAKSVSFGTAHPRHGTFNEKIDIFSINMSIKLTYLLNDSKIDSIKKNLSYDKLRLSTYKVT